jgi:glycerol-3-phosphate dehydrogenase (NAD(P)+)
MDTIQTSSIGVIGAGAWGTALAVTLARNGRRTELWGRDHQALMDIAARGENARYLPGIRLSPMPHVTRELSEIMEAGIVLLVVPAQEIRTLAPLMAIKTRPGQPIVICAKGIERGTGKMMSEVLHEYIPDAQVAVLSGPTFAREVAQGLPTAVTLACAEADLATRLCAQLSGRTFRCYASTDVVGVELCGAVKNVLAIACGIAMGRRLGENARAALITRGLAELRRLILAMGGKAETLNGLAGLGDLVLTCNSIQSRNYSLGHMLGEGQLLAEIEAHPHKLAEGRFTASAVVQRGDALGADIPICQAVDAILNRGADIDSTIATILARPLKAEGA